MYGCSWRSCNVFFFFILGAGVLGGPAGMIAGAAVGAAVGFGVGYGGAKLMQHKVFFIIILAY